MILPPELLRLILAVPTAPPEMLDEFRDDEERMHGMAHALIEMADLEDDCHDVEASIRKYDDQHFTVLLFFLGFIESSVLIEVRRRGEEDDDVDGESIPPGLLN